MRSKMAARIQSHLDKLILGKTRKHWEIIEIRAMIYTRYYVYHSVICNTTTCSNAKAIIQSIKIYGGQ